MSETKHTPTPWKAVSKLNAFNGSMIFYTSIEPAYEAGEDLAHLRMADGTYHICRFSHRSDAERVAKHMADAAFIVTAVNSHVSLVEENRRLREALEPFARIADMEEKAADGSSVIVNVSRCRDARAALSNQPVAGKEDGK